MGDNGVAMPNHGGNGHSHSSNKTTSWYTCQSLSPDSGSDRYVQGTADKCL